DLDGPIPESRRRGRPPGRQCPMRVGIDVQVVASGNRSGLYTCLRSAVREMRPLVNDRLWLFADCGQDGARTDAARISAAMEGARAGFGRAPAAPHGLRHQFAPGNRVDVLIPTLHALLPPATQAANAYFVLDVIPLAVDYGVPGFAKMYRPFYEAAARHADVI